MPVLLHQERHDGMALRSAPQTVALQRLADGLSGGGGLGSQGLVRLNLSWDIVKSGF
jgi:hypothetical protein